VIAKTPRHLDLGSGRSCSARIALARFARLASG
jgi:hypothetical protein